jgi:DNA-directed RNA polymerase subunit RPC12/RpoP
MAIEVTCKCGRIFTVAKDEWAGKRMACPQCGESLRIPQPDVPTQRVVPAVRVEDEGKSSGPPTRVILVGVQIPFSDLIPLLFQITFASVFVSAILSLIAGLVYFFFRAISAT